jgi:hypothetical protein
MATKIDVLNFTQSEMVARLLIIQRDWSGQPDTIVFNASKANAYAKRKVKENFTYPVGKGEIMSKNLLIFLYGNDNNIFSKAIK